MFTPAQFSIAHNGFSVLRKSIIYKILALFLWPCYQLDMSIMKTREPWNTIKQEFLKDLIELYKKHDVSISHEDSWGCFQLEKLTQSNVDWITAASTPDDYIPEQESAFKPTE
jgi:hypothetical protein